jgi:hypothetical protein
MPMLFAESFVLLALDPDGRVVRGMSNQPAVAVGVTGALITELVHDGHVDLGDGRIRPTGSTPAHPLLAQALANLAPHEGKKLKSCLAYVKHAGWSEVVDHMVAEGVLGREQRALRPTRHPVTDVAAHQTLLAGVRAAAVGDGPLDARTATLLALAGPCQMLEVVAPARTDRPKAKRRIAEASEGPSASASAAVRSVVEAVAATVAAAAAAAAGTG